MRLNFYEADCFSKIRDFEDICNTYNEIISLGIQVKEEQIQENFEKYCKDETYLEEENDRLNLFKYRMELLLLCCLSEAWEQNLYVFLKEAIKQKSERIKEKNDKFMHFEREKDNKKNKKDLCDLIEEIENNNDYKIVKKLYEKIFDINIEKNQKIKEMRELVNAIKHGPGRSLNNIKKSDNSDNDDIFLYSKFSKYIENGKKYSTKEIDVFHTTLNIESLNVEGKLNEYFESIKELWIDMNKKIRLGEKI